INLLIIVESYGGCVCLYSVLQDLEFRFYFDRTDLELSDPVAAYRLLWRLRDAWKAIFESTKLSPVWDYQYSLTKESHQFPDQEDIDGAAHGIIQLQQIYKLYPQDIWITTDPETGSKTILDMDEIFHLGRMAYELNYFQHAFLWFRQCFFQNLEREYRRHFTKYELYEYLASSAYEFGSLIYAVHYTKKLLNLDPTNLEIRHYLDYYESKHASHISYPDILMLDETPSSTYEALCKGEAKSRRKRQLTCRYSTVGGNPRLMYNPVKEEEEWDEPQIMRYHNVVSDTEIELLKNLSRPLVSHSYCIITVQSDILQNDMQQGDGLRLGKAHMCKSCEYVILSWIAEEYDPVVSRITQRLSDITGMDMESAETMEVLNYGIGGSFEPHYDALEMEKFTSQGDRIATILIYMSDVSIGGATVFPNIGVSLKPQKGSAVMWYNLLRSGQLDSRSLHAGCPVLQGSKWVCVKWLRERGQEFRRPCSLSETE
ncbi:hypothetical protein NFI96_031413, partial [Prochilodus magdalenae]